jgi:ankyrin repeat protein
MAVQDSQMNTSLHLVAKSGSTSVLKIVAEFSPNYKVTNKNGDTPLHVAVSQND